MSTVDTEMKKIQYADNILQYYDNVTYNIRLYILPKKYQDYISKLHKQGKSVNIDFKEKIIISQTGNNSSVFINRMEMETFYNSVDHPTTVIDTLIKLQLKEINTCNFINKLAIVGKLLGYDSQIGIPMWVDVWFSGYNNETHMPEKIIGNKVLTYDVIVSDVTTSVNDTGTTHDIQLRPAFTAAVSKEIRLLNDIGVIIEKKDGTISSFTKILQEKVNTKFFSQFDNPDEIRSKFPGGSMINIELIDGNSKYIEEIEKSDTPPDWYTQSNNTSTMENRDISSFSFSNKTTQKNTDSNTEVNVRPNKNTTLDNIFQEICHLTPQLQSDIATPIFNTETIGTYNGMELYYVTMKVFFITQPFIKWFIQHSKKGSYNVSKSNDDIETMKLEFIKEVIARKTLVKKYNYLFSGTDSTVLEMKSNIDKLWYVNSGIKDISYGLTGSNSNSEKINNDIFIENIKSSTDQEQLNKELENILSTSYEGADAIRSITADGGLYLDDIYRVITDTTKSNILQFRPVLEKSDPNSNNVSTITDSTTPEYQLSKIGLNNYYKSGNLVELELTIIGDPYWLWVQSTDSISAKSSNKIPSSSHYHFAFEMKTGYEIGTDGNYTTENVTDLSTIYQVVKTTSMFDSGKFTQHIKGVMEKVFMYSPTVKGIKNGS